MSEKEKWLKAASKIMSEQFTPKVMAQLEVDYITCGQTVIKLGPGGSVTRVDPLSLWREEVMGVKQKEEEKN